MAGAKAGKDLFGGITSDDEDDITTQAGGDEEEDIAIDALQDQASQAPVIRMVNSILSQAVRGHTSDVHISPEKDSIQLRFRVDKLRMIPAPPQGELFCRWSRSRSWATWTSPCPRFPRTAASPS